MIHITIRLYATLRRFGPPDLAPGQGFGIDLPDHSCLTDLIAALHLPAEETKQVFVQSRQREPGYLLADGEEVAIFPPVGGG